MAFRRRRFSKDLMVRLKHSGILSDGRERQNQCQNQVDEVTHIFLKYAYQASVLESNFECE
jgi:hypothetical protein